MEVTLSCMITKRDPILRGDTGGTSKGDPGAGGNEISRSRDGDPPKKDYPPMTAGQQAGAAILTAVVLGLLLLGMFWLWLDETSDRGPLDQMRGIPPSAVAAMTVVPVAGVAMSSRQSRVVAEKGYMGETTAEADTMPAEPESAFMFAAPAEVERSSVARQSRRASNMPLGWPHNPSIRSSVVDPAHSGQPSSRESPTMTDDDEIRPATPIR
jgi:mannan endo-1,6-alpha-mannosidase